MPGNNVTLAPAFSDMPPQYTPGEMMVTSVATKLFLSQPVNDPNDASAYGSLIAGCPVAIPSVVVIPDVFGTPPTMFTDSAESVPEPPTVNALLWLELSDRLQPLSSTAAVPCRVVAPLAVGSSEMTQPFPPIPTATERAEMLGDPEAKRLENSRVCGSRTITSTAF